MKIKIKKSIKPIKYENAISLLEERLDEIIEKRLRRFDKEMKHKDQFDTLLINDNIEVAIKDFIKKVNQITKGVY